MSEAEQRQWVEAYPYPGRANARDDRGSTVLFSAACREEDLSLVVWLLDEKGADVNGTTASGVSALHEAKTLDILIALLERGADPNMAGRGGWRALTYHVQKRSVELLARLLEDPRVRANINVQDKEGNTALHYACKRYSQHGTEEAAATVAHLLLQSGADPLVANNRGWTPLDMARHDPDKHAITALLEQALAESEKASLLIKARRLAVAANTNVVAPSCLQARVDQGHPLPRVELMPLTDGEDHGEEEENGEGEEGRKLRTTLAFMCGVGREGMPRDVFRVVMDLLMPSWDPLRRKNAGTGLQS